jgi:hypothetical protein
MLFPTIEFGLFFISVLVIAWSLHCINPLTTVTKRVVLLVTSRTLLALVVPCCAVYSQDHELGPTTPTAGKTSQPHAAGGQVFTSSMYGVRFVYPASYNFEPKRYANYSEPDFANQEEAVVFGTVEIPSAVYPGTNFEGGELAVSVSPAITNRAACDQFASGEPDSTVTIHGILYSVSNRGTAGMGHYQNYEILHTYQNGFCYEFMFEMETYNQGNLEDPSTVREFDDAPKIQTTLLSGISFSRPAAKPPAKTSGRPEILSFSPSSKVAGVGVDSSITFSWKSRSADYVRLQFSCAKGAVIGVIGPGTQAGTPCGSYSFAPNHSPDGSAAVIFGSSILDSHDLPPIPVTVTLVPFANGVAYPNLSKSITITIPREVPTFDFYMSLTVQSASRGEFSFARGSTVTIRWTDRNSPPDPCVNLYLVKDNEEGGETYLYKLSEPCLRSGSGSSSYSWTVTSHFSGDRFRILGAAPGGRAHALSLPFNIY